MALIVKHTYKQHQWLHLMNLAIFILLSAIWLFLESGIPCIIVECRVEFRLMSYFSFYLMPIPLLFFVRDTCEHEKKLLNGIVSLFVVSFAVNFVWLLLRDFVFPPTLIVVHVLIAVSVLALVAVSCNEYLHYKNRGASGLLLGFAGFAVLTAAGLLEYYIGKTRGYVLLWTFALFGFMIIISTVAAQEIILSISKAKNFEIIADAIPSGIFRARNDEHLTITYANDEYYRIYGYKSEATAKQAGFLNADDTMTVEEKAKFDLIRKQNIENGIYHFETEMEERNTSGNVLWTLNNFVYEPETDELFGSMIDITDRKTIDEQLRMREEEYRIAVAQSEKYILRYDIETKTIHQQHSSAELFGLEDCIQNVPESVIDSGVIAPESITVYRKFYEAIQHGEKSGQATIRMMNVVTGKYAWYHEDFTTVFDDSGKPKHGIVSFYDITESREKELAYERIRQDILSIPQSEISAFECNLTRDTTEKIDGKLLGASFDISASFDERTSEVLNQIHPDDRKKYSEIMHRERLLADFSEEIYSKSLEYRRKLDGSGYKWVRLTVQLVRYSDSNEIKAFVVVRDIDAKKREGLAIEERSQTDPLTHAMNRAAFAEQTDRLLRTGSAGIQHAFAMIDLDNFKEINDTYGHIEGDKVLTAVVSSLRSLLREGDMIGRIGGDEFMLCFKGIPFDEVIGRRAQLVCKTISSLPKLEARVSASIGVAMCPRDGKTFGEIYKKTDLAMYRAKQLGRNQYLFYSPYMDSEDHKAVNTPIDQE
ncbi:MAG: diguanylate cyclase [Oscillospiraceae bacterium]